MKNELIFDEINVFFLNIIDIVSSYSLKYAFVQSEYTIL